MSPPGLILDKYQSGTKTAVKRIRPLDQLRDATTQKNFETYWQLLVISEIRQLGERLRLNSEQRKTVTRRLS